MQKIPVKSTGFKAVPLIGGPLGGIPVLIPEDAPEDYRVIFDMEAFRYCRLMNALVKLGPVEWLFKFPRTSESSFMNLEVGIREWGTMNRKTLLARAYRMAGPFYGNDLHWSAIPYPTKVTIRTGEHSVHCNIDSSCKLQLLLETLT
jgi:hypothetical protein